MLPELTRDEKWQFVTLKEHHNEHHMLESTAQADADRRLELLKRIDEEFAAICMFCKGRLKDMGLGFEVTGHAADCKLAKELAGEVGSQD